jgi:hypothetical protein
MHKLKELLKRIKDTTTAGMVGADAIKHTPVNMNPTKKDLKKDVLAAKKILGMSDDD